MTQSATQQEAYGGPHNRGHGLTLVTSSVLDYIKNYIPSAVNELQCKNSNTDRVLTKFLLAMQTV